MKKINKVLVPLMATTCALAPTISLTSCGICSVDYINVVFTEDFDFLFLTVILDLKIRNWSEPWEQTTVEGDAVRLPKENCIRSPITKLVQSRTETLREDFSFTLSNQDKSRTQDYKLQLYLKTNDGQLVTYKLIEIEQ